MVGNERFWQNKVFAIKAENISDLAKKLNQFYEGKFVIATNIFPVQQVGEIQSYDAIVYYKVKSIEKQDKKPSEKTPEDKTDKNLATERQIEFLKSKNFQGDITKLTKIEATELIKGMIGK